MNLNRVCLLGKVTKLPDMRVTDAGLHICSFNLATNRIYKDKEGNKQQQAEFHSVVAFGKTAKVFSQYLRKEALLFVEGRLQTQSWETEEGVKHYRTQVIVEHFQFGPKREEQAVAKQEKIEQVPYPDEKDDNSIDPDSIPF